MALHFPKRKPKAAPLTAGQVIAKHIADSLPNTCYHGSAGFCEQCRNVEIQEEQLEQARAALAEAPDDRHLQDAFEAIRPGCDHGVEAGTCQQCAIDDGVIDPPTIKPLTPLEKLLKREARSQLGGLPKMDTTNEASGEPAPACWALLQG